MESIGWAPLKLILHSKGHNHHWHTHTHTREREREREYKRERERDTGQAAEDKTVGWYFLLGLVYRTCRTREKNWKTQQQKTERTVKKLLRPFSVMWRGTKEHSRPDSYSKKMNIKGRMEKYHRALWNPLDFFPKFRLFWIPLIFLDSI